MVAGGFRGFPSDGQSSGKLGKMVDQKYEVVGEGVK